MWTSTTSAVTCYSTESTIVGKQTPVSILMEFIPLCHELILLNILLSTVMHLEILKHLCSSTTASAFPSHSINEMHASPMTETPIYEMIISVLCTCELYIHCHSQQGHINNQTQNKHPSFHDDWAQTTCLVLHVYTYYRPVHCQKGWWGGVEVLCWNS